jgi:Suppressor of fused protein (SUFU)
LNQAAPLHDNSRRPCRRTPRRRSQLKGDLAISDQSDPSEDLYARRLAIYQRELGQPDFTSRSKDTRRIDVHAFGRDFAPDGDAGSDDGYVLLTNGMSEQRMPVPGHIGPDKARPRAELMWYVRDPTPRMCAELRWLASLPFIDQTWFSFGLRVPMPAPPFPDTDFKTFLFLTPIIKSDKRIAASLAVGGDPVEILTVNLVSDREYELIKTAGLNAFLDLLDRNDYPPIFDPARPSYV